MAKTYTGIDGELRIYDSTDDLRSEGGGDVQVYDATGPSWTDKTAEAYSAASSTTGNFLVDSGDYLYIGHTSPFARINVDLDTVGVGAGALTLEYYDGDSWESVSATDGTASGGNTLAQDGVISFKPPQDWAVQGDASLDSDKYYVRLSCASVPGTPPDAEQIYPVDGQYFIIRFVQMDLSITSGRARTEETMIHDRGRGSSLSHYISGPDDPIIEPTELSFSARLDTSINRTALLLAIQCGNPAYDTAWDSAGTTTKGDTDLTNGDASSFSIPSFDDSEKKTVCVQCLWEANSTKLGKALHEVYFPLEQNNMNEAEDSLMLALTGQVYGLQEDIYHFGYQY